MANAPRTAAPAQKPAQPMVGFDPMRPIKSIHHFVTGSFSGMLNGMAQWGSRGFTVGAIGGALLGIAAGSSFLGWLAIGMLAGSAAGIAFGGLLGAVTGGATRASRAQAAADARSHRQHAPSPFVDHGAATDRILDANFERTLQQNQILDSQQHSSWTDRVSQGHSGQGRGF